MDVRALLEFFWGKEVMSNENSRAKGRSRRRFDRDVAQPEPESTGIYLNYKRRGFHTWKMIRR